MHFQATFLPLLVLAAGCASAPETGTAASGPSPARLRVLGPELAHPDATRRRATVRALGVVGGPAIPMLLEGLGSERDPAVRDAYVRALGMCDAPEARLALARVAGDRAEDAGVRLAAVQGLTRVGAEEALISLARQPMPVGRAARLGLTIGGGARAREFFLYAMDNVALVVGDRRDVVAGFARLATPGDVSRLQTLCRDHDSVVRRLALMALGRLGASGARPLVARLARGDADASVRRAASIALYRIASR